MEAAAISAPAAAHDHHHGPPKANQSSKVHPEQLGILLFIISEAMLFGAFFAAYFFIRVVSGDQWPPGGEDLPIGLAATNAAILLSSSATMHWTDLSAKRGNQFAMRAGIVLTFLLGATFLFVQINEYLHLGFTPKTNASASVFFGLTGLHGAHVVIGLLLLLMSAIRIFKGRVTPESWKGLEVAGIYWHFVDVMWIVVFTTIYLL
jgi:cytochrome c oxidase subunit 3